MEALTWPCGRDRSTGAGEVVDGVASALLDQRQPAARVIAPAPQLASTGMGAVTIANSLRIVDNELPSTTMRLRVAAESADCGNSTNGTDTVWKRRRTHVTGVHLTAEPPLVGAWFVGASPDGIGPVPLQVMVMANRRIWGPHVVVSQGGRTIATRRLCRIARAGRPVALPLSLLTAVKSGGGEVIIGLVDDSYIPFDLRESGFHLPLSGP